MTVNELRKAKRTLERLVASAIYEFEVATEFVGRVNSVEVFHSTPAGTTQELIHVTADVSLGERHGVRYPEG